jgi:hypothetical protein
MRRFKEHPGDRADDIGDSLAIAIAIVIIGTAVVSFLHEVWIG